MNFLKTYTRTTGEPDTFLVYWTNTNISLKGLLKVRVTAEIEDNNVVAELAAMRYLLEDKGVVGNMVVGNANTQLIVSLGAIRKLQRKQSDKAHLAPYANFLTTRFTGSPITVGKDTDWFDGLPLPVAEELLVSEPCRESLMIAGCGSVAVTSHVLEKLAARHLPERDRSAQSAWKMLRAVAADTSMREVTRDSLWNEIKYERQGRQVGRYFFNAKHDLILVVTDNPQDGKRLVTTYHATRNFHDMQIAA